MIDYLEEIKKMISKQYHVAIEDIEEDSYLDADLSITDLDLEDLITTIEEKYDIQIPQASVNNFKKVQDISNYLYENIDSTTTT